MRSTLGIPQLSHMCIFKSILFFECFFQFLEFVGNKAKGRISKRVFNESKARQNFRKINISYLLIRTRACAYQEVRNVCFFENFGVLCFLLFSILLNDMTLTYKVLMYDDRNATSRTIHSRMFYIIGVLEYFAKPTGKRLYWSHSLIKLQVFRPVTLSKRNSSIVVFL